MLQYNHNDADDGERKEFEPMPVGDYDAVIETVEEKTSAAGNPMYAVTLVVYHGSDERKVWDYLPISNKMLWKLKRYAVALGAEAEFDTDAFDLTAYVGNSIVVELGIEPPRGKYHAKNTVEHVADKPGATIRKAHGSPVPSSAPGAPGDQAAHVPVSEDDIPF